MNIEEAIKIVKKIRQDYNLYYPMDRKEVEAVETLLTVYEKQSKEIEELKETLKCTQNSWYEDTQKIEELKENNKTLKNLQNDTNRLYIEMIERKNYFERELQKVVNKIKAKIEEVEQWELYNMKIPKLSTLDERLGAKIGIKYVLQSLLEKE